MNPVNIFKSIFATLLLITLAACGGGSSSDTDCTGTCASTRTLTAGGVKGPLTGVSWTLTEVGNAASIASGTSEPAFFFSNNSLSPNLNFPLLLELDVTGAIDSTTGVAPIMATLRTLVSLEMLDSNNPILVTPLSTFATDLLIADQGAANFQALSEAQGSLITQDRMDEASAQIMAVFGLGATQPINIFTDSPVILSDSAASASALSISALEKIIQFRKANEALALALRDAAALVTPTPITADAVLANLVAAFQPDRVFDGTDTGDGVQALRTALLGTTDTTVVGGGVTIGDLEDEIIASSGGDRAVTQPTVNTASQALFDSLASSGTPVAPLPGTVQVPSTDVSDDFDGDLEPNATDVFPLDPRLQAAGTDVDLDGVLDVDDNCTPADNSVFPSGPVVVATGGTNSGDLNSSQIDTDGDGFGDSCDSAPNDPSVFDDPDGDNIESISDNCWQVANATQLNLDRALILARAEFVANGNTPALTPFLNDIVASQGGSIASSVALQWIQNFAPFTADAPVEFGNACESDPGNTAGNDADGDGTTADVDLDDLNPDPSAVDSSLDQDGDLVQDFAAGGIDNCDGVANPGQENTDAADEAAALALSEQDLIDMGKAVGDACDIDIDNDGIANDYQESTGNPLAPNTVFASNPDLDPTTLNSTVFADAFGLTINLGAVDASDTFRLGVIGNSDIPAPGGNIDNPSENLLDFSLGADSDGTNILNNGAALTDNSIIPMFTQNRTINSQSGVLAFAADCSASCALGTAATSFPAAVDADLVFNTASSQAGFTAASEMGAVTTADADGDFPFVRNRGGEFVRFGGSWIGTQLFETSTFDAVNCTPTSGCVLQADIQDLFFRVFSRQSATTSFTTPFATDQYGLVEIDVSYSDNVATGLVNVTSNVNLVDRSANLSQFVTTSGLTAQSAAITYNNTADGAAGTLALSGSANGQITLDGNKTGFIDSTESLVTAASSSAGGGGATSTLGRAYAVKINNTVDASFFQNGGSGLTFDLLGFYVQADEAGYGIGRWQDSGSAAQQIQFEECPTDSNLLRAVIGSRSALIAIAYDGTGNAFPGVDANQLDTQLTSECFAFANGRFAPINFVLPAPDSGTALQLEGFYGDAGLLLRAVSARGDGVSGGGTPVTNVIVNGFDDQNGNDIIDGDNEVILGAPPTGNILIDFDAGGGLTEDEVACAAFNIPAVSCSTDLDALDQSAMQVFLDGNNFTVGTFVRSVTAATPGGGSGSPDIGFINAATGAAGTPQSGADVAVGGETYSAFTVGQGVLFGVCTNCP